MAKSKTSLFLCCFGSSHAFESSPTKPSTIPVSNIKKKKRKNKTTTTSCFSWLRIRFTKKSSHKTVPFEASIHSHHAHYSKVKSKSTLPHKPQSPATTNPPPSTQPPATPYYTPTQVFILIIILSNFHFAFVTLYFPFFYTFFNLLIVITSFFKKLIANKIPSKRSNL